MFIQFPIEKCVLPSPTGYGPAGMRGRPSIGRSTQVWYPALSAPHWLHLPLTHQNPKPVGTPFAILDDLFL